MRLPTWTRRIAIGRLAATSMFAALACTAAGPACAQNYVRLVVAFPPEVRFSGLSFSYNVAYAVFGGMTPPLVAWLSTAWGPMAPAHYVAFTSLVGVGVALWWLKRPLNPSL